MRSNRREIWIGGLAFLWMAGILGGYYLYHKPFDSAFALALVRWIWSLLTAILIVSLAGGIGFRIIPMDGKPGMMRGFIQCCLGLGILSHYVLLAGVFTQILTILIWAGSAVGILTFWRSIRSWWTGFADVRSLFTQTTPAIRWMIGLTAGIFMITGATSSAPPIQYDALTYHLALPQQYLQQNHIPALTDWVRSGMPQTGEMIYTWAMALSGGRGAALTGWLVGVLAVLSLVSLLRKAISPSAGWAGAASLLAGSSVAAALGWAYIDWFCLAFGLAALTCWMQVRVSARRNLLLTGIFCGLAFATKYTGGVILAGMAFLVLVRPGNKIRDLGSLILGALIPAIPWLVKNTLFTGNPLAPFTFSPGGGTASFVQNSSSFGNLLDVFVLPLRATWIGVEGGVGYSHAIGPLLLLFGVFFWLQRDVGKQMHPLVADASVLGAVAILLWIIGNQFNGLLVQSRMYYAVFPAFAVLAAAGYEGLSSLEVPGVRVRRLLEIVLILVVGLTLVELARSAIRKNVGQVLTGIRDESEYIDENLGWYGPAMREIRSGKELTLLIYEPRGYYCSPECVPDEVLGRWSTDFHRLGSCGAVIDSWQAKGYRRVLVNAGGVEFFLTENDPNHTAGDLSALQQCVAELPRLLDFGETYQLFAID